MSYAKLKGKIVEVFGTQESFAIAMEFDPSTLSSRLNNKSEWKRNEMEKAGTLLNIPIEKVHEYFFTKKVAKTQL